VKSIFATSSAIEASLLRDLLAQHEIHAEISGETIERGIGSAGSVSDSVAADNVEAAQEIVRGFQAESDRLEQEDATTTRRSNRAVSETSLFPGKAIVFLGGLRTGIAGCFGWFYITMPQNHSDNNGDGNADEVYVYLRDRLANHKADCNFDGKIDTWTTYDLRGKIKTHSSDWDFDGTVDETITYHNNWPHHGVVILPDVEYREKYRYGSVSERRYLLDGFTRKVSYFDTMGIRRDHIDADGDGKIDTEVQFDEAYDEESPASAFAKASADKSRISRKRSAAAFTHPPSPRLRRTSHTSRPCLFS
jgi:hypothetical protein